MSDEKNNDLNGGAGEDDKANATQQPTAKDIANAKKERTAIQKKRDARENELKEKDELSEDEKKDLRHISLSAKHERGELDGASASAFLNDFGGTPFGVNK